MHDKYFSCAARRTMRYSSLLRCSGRHLALPLIKTLKEFNELLELKSSKQYMSCELFVISAFNTCPSDAG